MGTMLAVGDNIIIDGLLWVVEQFRGENDKLAYARHEETNRGIWFSAGEAMAIGGSLWGLPGRIEAPAAKSASVVASPASADVRLNG